MQTTPPKPAASLEVFGSDKQLLDAIYSATAATLMQAAANIRLQLQQARQGRRIDDWDSAQLENLALGIEHVIDDELEPQRRAVNGRPDDPETAATLALFQRVERAIFRR